MRLLAQIIKLAGRAKLAKSRRTTGGVVIESMFPVIQCDLTADANRTGIQSLPASPAAISKI